MGYNFISYRLIQAGTGLYNIVLAASPGEHEQQGDGAYTLSHQADHYQFGSNRRIMSLLDALRTVTTDVLPHYFKYLMDNWSTVTTTSGSRMGD